MNLSFDSIQLVLLALVLVIALAAAGGRFALLLGQPRVVGEMMVGLLCGHSVLGEAAPQLHRWLFQAEAVHALRWIGGISVSMFVFTSAAKLDWGHARLRTPLVFTVSNLSTILPFILGGLLLPRFLPSADLSLKEQWLRAGFLGIATSVTALPVLLRIIQQNGLEKTPLAIIAVSCAVADDVFVWAGLILLTALAGQAELAAAIWRVVGVAGFVVLMLTVGRAMVARLVPWAERKSVFFVVALIVAVLVGCAWTTRLLGVHEWSGAFLAGCSLPSTRAVQRVLHFLQRAFGGLLLPVFFATAGLAADLGFVFSSHGVALCGGIVALAVLGKLGGATIGARLHGMSWSEAFSLGSLLNTRGLVELVVIRIGLEAGIIDRSTYSLLAVMALVTTLMTNPLLALGNVLGKDKRANEPAFLSPRGGT